MKNILESKIILQYKKVAIEMLKLSFPSLSTTELNSAVDWSLLKHVKDGKAYIDNNYKHKQINVTLLGLADYIIEREPIITSAGVIFAKHANSVNPMYLMIDTFINNRGIHKDLMFKYPKGSQDFNKYNLLQLLDKLDSNALYGTLGAYSSIYYNLYIASSITTQGKSCITSAIMLFESFLANNVKFTSLNDVINFIYNIKNERSTRKFKDHEVLDNNITTVDCLYQIAATCGIEWVPTEKDLDIIWKTISRLDQEDINRLYYKNNLYSFMDNGSVSRALVAILQGLHRPFLDPNKPNKEIKVELDVLCDIIKEYVYYGHQFIDRIPRVETMIRDVAIISDTDSSIVSFDAWYNYCLEKVIDIPMIIKTEFTTPFEHVKKDEFGDFICTDLFEHIEPVYDYNFYTEEVINLERTIYPNKIIPQDGLRYSIINIMAYCISQLVLDYMYKYSINSHSAADNRKCLLILKNEYLFRKVLITDAKKNYANIQEIQEGNVVPKSEQFKIMGMSMEKSTLSKATRTKLKSILYEDVLNSDNIDQVKVLKDLAIAEKQIYNSLLEGNKEFYKPLKIKSINSYDDPMRIQGIKASIVYNTLRDEGTDTIDLNARNSILIIKTNINIKSIEEIHEEHPDKYEKICDLLETAVFKDGIDAVAIPINIDVPNWVLSFIDYHTIINDNIKNFPIESISISRLKRNNVNYANILKI